MSFGLQRFVLKLESSILRTGIMSMVKSMSDNGALAQPATENLKRELDTEENTDSNKKLCTDKEEFQRVKKRKYAMMLGYVGQDYQGMQKNPETKTIEGELFNAMKQAGIIPADYDEAGPNLIQFQRGSRTDKGVSAVRQVVSLKLPETAKVEEINKYLPEQIRVFSMKRVTKGFNSKFNCDARTYSYTMPSYAFAPGKALSIQEDYRLSVEEIDRINTVLKSFLGTKNYHNFTIRKSPEDPSARRYIMSFNCDDIFVNKYEFVTLKIKGQSFMLHQIRKMVAYTIAMIKGLIPENVAANLFTHHRYNIPLAPGLGLVLEEIHYRRYDSRYGKDGMHENLEWADVDDQVKKFKQDMIVSSILETELSKNPMFDWLQTLNEHDFVNLRHYGNEEDEEEGSEDVKRENEIVEGDKNQDEEKVEK